MSHTIRDWMSRPVIVVDRDSSVSYAMTLMRRRNRSVQRHQGPRAQEDLERPLPRAPALGDVAHIAACAST